MRLWQPTGRQSQTNIRCLEATELLGCGLACGGPNHATRFVSGHGVHTIADWWRDGVLRASVAASAASAASAAITAKVSGNRFAMEAAKDPWKSIWIFASIDIFHGPVSHSVVVPPQDGVVVTIAGVQLVFPGQIFGQNARRLPWAKYGEPVVAISDQFGMAIAEGAIKARAPLVIVIGAIWTWMALEAIHANG